MTLHLVRGPDRDAGRGSGSDAHTRGEGLEGGGEREVLGDAEHGDDGDAFGDVVGLQFGAVCSEESVIVSLISTLLDHYTS